MPNRIKRAHHSGGLSICQGRGSASLFLCREELRSATERNSSADLRQGVPDAEKQAISPHHYNNGCYLFLPRWLSFPRVLVIKPSPLGSAVPGLSGQHKSQSSIPVKHTTVKDMSRGVLKSVKRPLTYLDTLLTGCPITSQTRPGLSV